MAKHPPVPLACAVRPVDGSKVTASRATTATSATVTRPLATSPRFPTLLVMRANMGLLLWSEGPAPARTTVTTSLAESSAQAECANRKVDARGVHDME